MTRSKAQKQNKKSTKTGSTKGKNTNGNEMVSKFRRGLDAQARKLAALIADPCAGPLVEPIYLGETDGFLTRFETDIIISNGATESAAAFAFVPGAIGATGGAGAFGSWMNANAAAMTNDGVVTGFQNTAANQPGITMLSGNSRAVRVVAACLQVYYPGSELNRAGIIGVGQCSASTFASNTSAGSLRTLAPYVARMPSTYMEVKLKPSDGEASWSDPGASTTLTDFENYQALFVSLGGGPLATGIRVRCVAVYQWIPSTSSGLIAPATSNPSSSSMRDVLSYLQSAGNWMYANGDAINRVATTVAYGVKKTAPLLLM
jgi:hypothetical protein